MTVRMAADSTKKREARIALNRDDHGGFTEPRAFLRWREVYRAMFLFVERIVHFECKPKGSWRCILYADDTSQGTR
jgi:hypothetical protein